jgi:hypothetical protein
MLCFISLLVAFCLSASAAVIHRQAPSDSGVCSFVIGAVGSVNGSVVQDTIGENRVGGTYPQGNYYISNGSLIDSLHHNCVILTGTSQFQCISGNSGASNFSIADDGNLLQDGIENWFACPASGPGDDGSYNIFGDALTSTSACQPITLRSGGFNCTALGRPPASTSSATSLPTHDASTISSASVSTTSSASASATANAACPTDISAGVFQFPHLIVPTSPKEPDHSFGNSYSAYISPINTTLFNFDIPSAAPYNGTCALLFLFPFGGATYFSGTEEEEGEKGGLDFAMLAEVANSNTTYDTTGDVAAEYGKVEVLPGNNYTVATFYCGAGTTITYQVSSKGNVELDYFQTSAPNPMGLYIVPCDSTCD